jgi:dihydroflavonol-4-reductase
MTALVTGGSGFIGGHVVRALLAAGRRVRCLIRPSSDLRNLEGLDVEYATGDLTDAESVRSAMAGCDVVFHGAADYRLFAPDPAELYRNNVGGTRNVLAAAADARVQRVVYTSSVATLAPSRDGAPVDESAAATTSLDDMLGDYKRSKFLAEREVDAACARGLPVVVVNPSTPVGDGDIKPTPTGQIIVDFLNGRMPAYVDTGLNLVDVRDVAAGHLLAADNGRPGERYILANQNLTLKQVLDMLARLSGRHAPHVRLPHWLPLAIAHVETPIARWLGRAPRVPLDGVRMSRRRMFFDGSKAVRELGMPQSPIDAALRRAVDWFSRRGYCAQNPQRVPNLPR